MGLRSFVREDAKASPAKFVFGKALRLPGEFFAETNLDTPNPISFVEEFRQHMRAVCPIPVAHNYKKNFRLFVFKDMNTCTHVMHQNTLKKKFWEHGNI